MMYVFNSCQRLNDLLFSVLTYYKHFMNFAIFLMHVCRGVVSENAVVRLYVTLRRERVCNDPRNHVRELDVIIIATKTHTAVTNSELFCTKRDWITIDCTSQSKQIPLCNNSFAAYTYAFVQNSVLPIWQWAYIYRARIYMMKAHNPCEHVRCISHSYRE